MKKLLSILLSIILLTSSFVLYVNAQGDEQDPQEPQVVFRTHEKKIYSSDEKVKLIDAIKVWEAPKRYNTGATWAISPVIFKTTDAVKPGYSFHLYGDGFTAKDMKIAIRIADSAIPQEKPPADCVLLNAVQIDPEIKYVTVQLPSDMPAGVYDVWASNKAGWSYPVRLNEAKYEYTMETEMAQGMVGTAYGKNFDGKEFASSENVKVALVNNDKTYEVPVVSVNPFRIEYYIPIDLPPATYKVYISNNGGVVWSDVDICQINQDLIVHEKFNDKFNLGVGWANQFNYERVINVKDNGAKADGVTDDTAAIQKTIDVVKEQGGGMAYIPDGKYFMGGNLRIPAGVILAGAGQTKTFLYYDYQGDKKAKDQGFISVKDDGRTEGRVGLYGFTIQTTMNPDKEAPDSFISLGDPWGEQKHAGARTTKYIFVKDICIDSKIVQRAEGRMFAVTIVGDSHFLLEGCNFKGSRTSLCYSYFNYFVIIRNSDWYTASGNILNAGLYQTFLDNKMIRYPELRGPSIKDENTQGIFFRGPAYLSENYVENTGKAGDNDGELFCSENAGGGGTRLAGDAVSATANTVTLDIQAIKSWDFDQVLWGKYFYLVVVYGRGQGQAAYITKADEKTKTFTLDRDWDIMPDKTSKMIAFVTSTNVTMYKNNAYKGAKGYWLYGHVFDSVIADNVGTDTEGAYIFTCLKDIPSPTDNPSSLRLDIDYFNRITRNSFTGGSKKTNIGAISISSNLEYKKQPARVTAIYGAVVSDNIIKDANKEFKIDNSEAPDFNGINITHNLYFPAMKAVTATKGVILENNKVINSTNGISLGGYAYFGRDDWTENSKQFLTQGIVMKGNTFENVTTPFRESGVNGVKNLN